MAVLGDPAGVVLGREPVLFGLVAGRVEVVEAPAPWQLWRQVLPWGCELTATLTPAQWAQARDEVLDLVARCRPKFPKEVAMLAGSLCAVLATYADEVEDPRIEALLTQQNVDRLIVKYQLENMKSGSLGQQRVRLRRLLRVHSGQPKSPSAAPRTQQRLAGYTEEETQDLIDFLGTAPAPVRQAGMDALLLGLGYGIVVPALADLAMEGAAGLTFRGVRLLAPGPTVTPELRAHFPKLRPLSRADWKGVRDWLAWQGAGRDLTAQRLRDSWLASRTRDSATATPLMVLMSADGVGRQRLVRVGAETIDPTDPRLSLLRDF